MDYDEDDLYDHESDGQGEDVFEEYRLNNEDYDKLHEMLPILKSKLTAYNDEVPEIDLKEALYFNYFELEPSLEEIKSKFKKSMYHFVLTSCMSLRVS